MNEALAMRIMLTDAIGAGVDVTDWTLEHGSVANGRNWKLLDGKGMTLAIFGRTKQSAIAGMAAMSCAYATVPRSDGD